MIRRFLYAAAMIGFCGISLWAAEQATFVLNNGEQHRGTLVYGRGSNNIVDGRFHLSASGNELTFGIDDVAVVDFAGGTPTPAERQALPNDNMGLMVMRNGSVQRGHLHNLVDGDVVQWVNEAGQRNNYSIRDVSRVYLNPRSARTVFNDNGPAAAVGGRTITVDARQAWTDTGVTVNRGDHVVFQASGEIQFARGPGQSVTPNGGTERRASYPDPTVPVGALIGRIGKSAPFAIGMQTQPLPMPESGRLMLGVNDNDLSNNRGSFTVIVTKQ